MSWNNLLYRSIIEERRRRRFFTQALGVLCLTGFATIFVVLAPSVQAANSVLYVTNSDGTIVGFDSNGNRTLVASDALDGRLSNDLEGLAFDSSGNLYVANSGADNILKFDTSGAGSIFASVSDPRGVAVDGNGNVFVTTPGGVIKKISSGGVVSTFFEDPNRCLTGLAFNDGSLYVGNPINSSEDAVFLKSIFVLNDSGEITENIFANLGDPFAIAFINTQLFTTLTNTAEVVDAGLTDIPIYAVEPSGIASDSSGNLYVADRGVPPTFCSTPTPSPTPPPLPIPSPTPNAIFKFDTNAQLSVFADFDLFEPNFLAFGPPISAPVVSIAPHSGPAPLENARKDTITVTRSGQLDQTLTVLLYTVDDTRYSPQLLHQTFSGIDPFSFEQVPYYYSTNDAQFQDALRARAGTDYQPVSKTLVFKPNETSKTVKIRLKKNKTFDGRRQFAVALKAESAPLTVGPNLIENIIDDDATVAVAGFTLLQSSVNDDGTTDQNGNPVFTRTFSGTLNVLNVSASQTGPIRVRLVAHANYNDRPDHPTIPLPSPPPDTDLAVAPVASSGLPPNGSGIANFTNVVIPAPSGDAYGYNTWFWVYAIVEQQTNGTWSATSLPWLLIDGTRLVAGYVSPNGVTVARVHWEFGGDNTGTPASPVDWGGGVGLTGTSADIPVVTISVSPTQISEGTSGMFQIAATPGTFRPITVGFTMGGTAIRDTDYTLSPNVSQMTIPMGVDSVSVTLNSIADGVSEKKKETAIMTLQPGAGGEYKLAKKKKAKVKILDVP